MIESRLIGPAIRGRADDIPLSGFSSRSYCTVRTTTNQQTNKMKRKTQDPTANPPPKKKKPHPNPQPKNAARQEPLHPSINDLKRQIRNAKRLLARDDLPADTRIVQERALAEYERELGEETRRRERREMIGRYHFVRFLDRKSASKELKRLLRKEKDAAAKAGSEVEAPSKESDKEDDAGNLAEKIHIARVNLNYTIYYPLTEKYISLYADKQQQKRKQKKGISNGDADSQDLSDNENENDNGDPPDSQQTPRPAMWYVVEKCMEEGQKKLELLREGKSGDVSASGDVVRPEDNTGSGSSRPDRSKRKDKENGKKEKDVEMRDAHDGEGNADDSDGGFFEG